VCWTFTCIAKLGKVAADLLLFTVVKSKTRGFAVVYSGYNQKDRFISCERGRFLDLHVNYIKKIVTHSSYSKLNVVYIVLDVPFPVGMSHLVSSSTVRFSGICS